MFDHKALGVIDFVRSLDFPAFFLLEAFGDGGGQGHLVAPTSLGSAFQVCPCLFEEAMVFVQASSSGAVYRHAQDLHA